VRAGLQSEPTRRDRAADAARSSGSGRTNSKPAREAYVLKPKGIPHAFWNATDEPARLIDLIWPAGFETFFGELATAYRDGDGTPAPDRVAALADRYDVEPDAPSYIEGE
jgi:hypothetical protein